MKKKIEIISILPVFNRINETLLCLKNLISLNNNEININVVLIDDGSTDNTSARITSLYPSVNIVYGDGTLWWAGGVNKGFEYVEKCKEEYDYILILNNDTIFNAKTFNELLSVVKNQPKSVCAPVVVDEDSGSVYNAGLIQKGLLKELKPIHRSIFEKNEDVICDSVGTRFVLMPSQIILEVGFFDSKKFPHGYSDFDYFLRAKEKGYSIIVNTNSVISTVQNRNYLQYRLIEQTVNEFIKSFFDIKYSNNIKLQFYESFSHKPVWAGGILFIKRMISLTRWLLLKVVLSEKKLKQIVENKWGL